MKPRLGTGESTYRAVSFLCHEAISIFLDRGRTSKEGTRATHSPAGRNYQKHVETATRAGSILEERYRLERLLGEGGHGAVWLATDIQLDRPVAIKMVSAGLGDGGQTVARLQREAKALQRLEHPNIVQVFRIGTIDYETFFLAMEHVEGRDLHALLEERSLSVGEAAALAVQICAGMLAAEKRGVIHRDLKPHNILVVEKADGPPQVKVADFGLCTMSLDATMQFGELTRAGSTLGTPFYMSPEQCQGQPIDVRSDIYSFGCLLFEMLTGSPPYEGDSAAAILMKHVKEPIPNLMEVTQRTEVAELLQNVISKCMAKNPRDRYQSFEALSADLSIIDSMRSTARLKAYPTNQPARRRHPKLVLLAVAVTVPLVLLGAAIGFSNDEQRGFWFLKLGETLSPAHPQSLILGGIQATGTLAGKASSRKAAEATILNESFRAWPFEQRLELLSAYVGMFGDDRTAGATTASGGDANLFAVALLDTCMHTVADQADGHVMLTAPQKQMVADNLNLLLHKEWNNQTWKAFSQTVFEYSHTFQLHSVATMPDTDPYAMLIEELCGEIILRNNPSQSSDLNRTAAEMLFNASQRAARTGKLDQARHYCDRLGLVRNDAEIDARLAVVGWALQLKRPDVAREEFKTCERLRAGGAFPRLTTETTYKNFKAIFASQSP